MKKNKKRFYRKAEKEIIKLILLNGLINPLDNTRKNIRNYLKEFISHHKTGLTPKKHLFFETERVGAELIPGQILEINATEFHTKVGNGSFINAIKLGVIEINTKAAQNAVKKGLLPLTQSELKKLIRKKSIEPRVLAYIGAKYTKTKSIEKQVSKTPRK